MNKFFTRFVTSVWVLMGMCVAAMAQQLPDPSFEDWSGAQFDGNIQPKYWNYSNVDQLGIAKFNFAQRETGRTGSYAMKVQDQDLKVMGIGATSPGYIALGQPWAYVSDIGSINKATAGTHGGISWAYRPDTMTVWIKRTGSRTGDENYNILFYSWIGTSEGASYKAKDGSCSSVPDAYRFDEESDIRIALDKNECSTVTAGTQVAEGWIYERKTYENWTKIKVPIYYMNDSKPQKCNVIFSASNYPNFRANDGLYAGNTLIVDDVELIYSSAIQKLYIGGKEWKNFDGNNHGVQTYSLGQGATTIPQITAYRGAGKMTNPAGKSATFPGRKLDGSELTIEQGAVDGAPCKITVRSEDGKSTSTYLVQFVSQQSNNAMLSGISVNGTPISGFNQLVTSYNVALPYGTKEAPVVTVSKQEEVQTVSITQAKTVTDKATIVVTAQDGATKKTYTVQFSVAALSDNTLKDILIDGKSLVGFAPTKSNYTVELPLTTTKAPEVTPVSAYEQGAQTIKITENTLDVEAKTGRCQITVSAPAATSVRTYTLNYKVTPSSYSWLQMIYLDGEELEGFEPATLQYDITLPMGTKQLPAITWTEGDAYQTVVKTEGGVDGVTRLQVTAGSGATSLYRLSFKTLKSSNNALAGLLIDGDTLATFDAEQLEYTITLPAGTKTAPTVTAIAGDDYQMVRVVNGGLTAPTRVIVTAGDGSTRTYILYFEVEKSAGALLAMIYVGGEPLAGFEPETNDYRYRLTGATAPAITVDKMDGQTVMISQPKGVGVARIIVQPEEGEQNTYSVTFYDETEIVYPEPKTPVYEPEHNAALQMIYLDGDSLRDFDAEVMEYTIVLPKTASEQPTLTAVAASDKARTIIFTQGEANANATVRVIAEDSVTTKDYVLHFPYAKSSNTALEDIDANGYMTFVASQKVYNFDLPYEVDFPDVYVTQAEETQAVAIEYLNCKTRRDVMITVTAEDGTVGTYEVHMAKPTHPDNVLRSIYADAFLLDSLTLNSADTLHVSLPYDATELGLSGIDKNYDEQYVVVDDGGVSKITTIWVYSGRAGEVAKVYTLVPELQKSPFLMWNIMADGATIPTYAMDRYNYVMSVAAKPTMTATLAEGAELEVVTENAKCWQARVNYNSVDGPLYTVWFYYPGDVTFGGSFEDWTDNRPNGWHSAVDASTSGDKGSYNPKDSYAVSTDATQGSSSANLKTAYLLTSAEAMPGILSLSEQTVSVGAYYVFGHTASTLSFGNGITFRNTPDSVALDYKTIANNKVTGWHWKWMANNETTFDYEGNYNTKNQWLTVSKRLTYAADFVPEMLDIRINPAHSETLGDFYVGTSGASTSNRFTSSMLVDNMRMFYNSKLKGITYNGDTIAPDASKHFAITVPTETVGVPTIGFVYTVADQAAVLTWGEEVNGVREATIRNYAEDGSYTDYTLTVTRALSTDAGYTAASSVATTGARRAKANTIADLYIQTNSPYATTAVVMLADSVVLTVTPETGAAVQGQYAAIDYDTIRTSIAPVLPAVGKDSISTISNETIYSDDVTLAYIVLGTDTLSSYEPEQLSYSLYTAANAIATAGKANEQQTITVEHHTLSDGADLYYIYVRAGNGATRLYQVVEHHTLPSTDATLSSIALNGELIDGFLSDTYTYTISLPVHSELPDVVAQPTDAAATLMATLTGNDMTIVVTAEDGVTKLTYSLSFDIPASDYTHLEQILLDGELVEGYDPMTTTYDIVLPVGTTMLPMLSYVKAEAVETVVTDTVALEQGVGEYRLTVTAEDGVSTRVYTLHFTVAKSNNCLLEDILSNGESIAEFYAEMTTPMTINVAYGSELPIITYVKQEDAQTVVVDTITDGLNIVVTAEDGISQKTYTVLFNYLPSGNTDLELILLNGDTLPEFEATEYEYYITLPAGSTLPEVTVVPGDEQQTIDIRWEGNICYVDVTAGNGEQMTYTITFEILKSENCLLSDLRVRGVTIEGFKPEEVMYALEYAWRSPDSVMAKLADIVAIPQDAEATVTMEELEDHTILIHVLAADGVHLQVYQISQSIALNALLKMIYINGAEIRGFDPNEHYYEYILTDGVQTVEIEGVPMDENCEVTYSIITLDSITTIYTYVEEVTADGSVRTLEDEYQIYIYHTDLDASIEAELTDVAFVPVPGSKSFVAVSIRSGVQVAVYDYMGHMYLLSNVPVCDPNDLDIRKDDNGREYINEVYPGAEGVEFTAPAAGTPYIYVFYHSTNNKRFTKGGKFLGR